MTSIESDPAPIKVAGQGSFPASVGSLTVTWPLAVALADVDGISIQLRYQPMRHLFRPLLGGRSLGVCAKWEEVRSIDVASRSMVLTVRNGDSCRFQPLRRHSLAPLLDMANSKGVPIRLVGTTVGWYLKPRA